MSVAGKAIGDTTPTRAYQPVRLVDDTGAPITPAGGGTGTSSQQVQGALAHDAPYSIINPVLVGGYASTTAPTVVAAGDAVRGWFGLNGQAVTTLVDASGNNITNSNGTDVAGNSNGVNANSYPWLFNGTTWNRAKKPSLAARLLTAAASTNDTLVRAGIGDLFRIQGYNTNAAARYLKLYNKATAPTSADTPIMTRRLAPQSEFVLDFPTPFYFSLGIGYRLTTGVADADTGALTAGDVEAMNIAYA